jgi:hypothetical protein
MKKTLITAAAIATTSMAAQAEDKSNTLPDSLNLFGAYSAGYMFETEEVHHTLRFGVEHVSTLYFLQLGFYNADLIESSELDTLSFSAGVIGRRQLARNFVGYIGGSVGFANAEGSFEGFNGRETDDDFVLYTDAVAGFELLVSENISFNAGLRGMYAGDASIFDYEGGIFGADELDKEFDFAAELGVTIRF